MTLQWDESHSLCIITAQDVRKGLFLDSTS